MGGFEIGNCVGTHLGAEEGTVTGEPVGFDTGCGEVGLQTFGDCVGTPFGADDGAPTGDPVGFAAGNIAPINESEWTAVLKVSNFPDCSSSCSTDSICSSR